MGDTPRRWRWEGEQKQCSDKGGTSGACNLAIQMGSGRAGSWVRQAPHRQVNQWLGLGRVMPSPDDPNDPDTVSSVVVSPRSWHPLGFTPFGCIKQNSGWPCDRGHNAWWRSRLTAPTLECKIRAVQPCVLIFLPSMMCPGVLLQHSVAWRLLRRRSRFK